MTASRAANPTSGQCARETVRVVMGTGCTVASAHPLATAAGMDVLRRGSNAMDAAIVMAGVTCAALPSMCGLGGDTFLVHYDAESGRVEALNGSGIVSYDATLEGYAAMGYKEKMPLSGPLSVAIPGWTSLPGTDPAGIEQPVRLHMENRFSKAVRDELANLGHEIQLVDAWGGGGSVQLIMINPETGVRFGASDPRGDGSCLAF